MPFIKPTGVNRLTRIHIVGETGSGKSTALGTFPGPRVIVSMPGEHGYGSIKHKDAEDPKYVDPETTLLVYQADKLSPNPASAQVVRDVEKALYEAANMPGLQTLCIDGLHKLLDYAMDDITAGNWFEGSVVKDQKGNLEDTVPPTAYGQLARWLRGFLNPLIQSKVPYIVFTSWDADKAVRKAKPGEHWSQVEKAKLPALIGEAARTILGEFGVTIHASKGTWFDANGKELGKGFRWQTKSDGGTLAAQIKAPPEVVEKIPKFVEAKWPTLASYLGLNAS